MSQDVHVLCNPFKHVYIVTMASIALAFLALLLQKLQPLCSELIISTLYCAVQAGLLTPLTFTRHRLSPLAASTSGAYFLHNGRRWQWISKFYTAHFNDIFEGP